MPCSVVVRLPKFQRSMLLPSSGLSDWDGKEWAQSGGGGVAGALASRKWEGREPVASVTSVRREH